MNLKSFFFLRNCELIFRLAEEELGIPSLLDPVDMVGTNMTKSLNLPRHPNLIKHSIHHEKKQE